MTLTETFFALARRCAPSHVRGKGELLHIPNSELASMRILNSREYVSD